MTEDNKHQKEIFTSIDQEILGYYQRFLGSSGRQVFQEKVLSLAKQVLSLQTDVYRQTLEALINVVAARNYSSLRIDHFWITEVSVDTFLFQRDFKLLTTPDLRTSAETVFHINSLSLLRSVQNRNSRLLPAYILEDRPYNEKNDRETGGETIYFVDGDVDRVARFLAGFALTSKTSNWREKDFMMVNGLRFRETVALAVAKRRDTVEEGAHETHTLYSPLKPTEEVKIYVSRKPTPVEVVTLPLTVLLPSQIEELQREGDERYEHGDFKKVFRVQPEGKQDAGDIFATSRHAELVLKYLLLRYV